MKTITKDSLRQYIEKDISKTGTILLTDNTRINMLDLSDILKEKEDIFEGFDETLHFDMITNEPFKIIKLRYKL